MRFRVPDEGEIAVEDLIRGEVRFPLSSLQDFVIQRSDGSPLYNLAVAVDDRDMGVTHVIRGDDHLSNTPRQALMLEALGAAPAGLRAPAAAAWPGRQEALEAPRRRVGAGAARARATCPRRCATTSRCSAGATRTRARSSPPSSWWSAFDLRRVSRSPAVFDEQKLRWMNGRYLRELPVEELRALLEERLGRELSAEAVAISQEKMQTLADFWPLAGFLVEPQPVDEKAWSKVMDEDGVERLRAARDALAPVDPFDAAGGGDRAARGGGDAWASSRRTCSSRCEWRSAARPCLRESSSRWRRSAATRLCGASKPLWSGRPRPARRLPPTQPLPR